MIDTPSSVSERDEILALLSGADMRKIGEKLGIIAGEKDNLTPGRLAARMRACSFADRFIRRRRSPPTLAKPPDLTRLREDVIHSRQRHRQHYFEQRPVLAV